MTDHIAAAEAAAHFLDPRPQFATTTVANIGEIYTGEQCAAAIRAVVAELRQARERLKELDDIKAVWGMK